MKYILLVAVFWCSTALADIPDDKAVLAIIGEFENDNIQAGACTLYNRGTLKGVYGINSKRVKNRLYSDYIYNKAVESWRNAKSGLGCEMVANADHWQSVSDMRKEAKWRNSCKMTYFSGKTYFFKCGK